MSNSQLYFSHDEPKHGSHVYNRADDELICLPRNRGRSGRWPLILLCVLQSSLLIHPQTHTKLLISAAPRGYEGSSSIVTSWLNSLDFALTISREPSSALEERLVLYSSFPRSMPAAIVLRTDCYVAVIPILRLDI